MEQKNKFTLIQESCTCNFIFLPSPSHAWFLDQCKISLLPLPVVRDSWINVILSICSSPCRAWFLDQCKIRLPPPPCRAWFLNQCKFIFLLHPHDREGQKNKLDLYWSRNHAELGGGRKINLHWFRIHARQRGADKLIDVDLGIMHSWINVNLFIFVSPPCCAWIRNKCK
jgi:hypothetical protein